MIKVLPSILAADFAKLGEEARRVELAGADELHVDIMDGAFVPNISFGACVVEALRAACKLPLDVHMMVQDPVRYVADMVKAGATRVTVHIEATQHIHRTIQVIRDLGVEAGVALNPGTPAEAIRAILPEVQLVLAMTVNPGFGGQRLIPSVLPKIEALHAMIRESGAHAVLEVDGGVTPENAAQLTSRGVTLLVAGSAVFRAKDPAAVIAGLRGE